MQRCLQGLAFERVPAVDGKRLDGQEYRDESRPVGADNMTRYELACVQSHRLAWSRFLAEGGVYGCVLEDDLILSPNFPRFVSDASWISAGCNLVKIETYCEKVMLSRATVGAWDRQLTELRSLHQGSGAYTLSRRGAEMLLAETARPSLPLDLLMFGADVLQQRGPLHQLFPALCVQAKHMPGGIDFEEMQSSIQPQPAKRSRPLLKRIRRDMTRPFRKLHAFGGRLIFQLRANARHLVVPYA